MKRLTFEGNFCDIAQCRENPCPYNGSCSQREVWERLKQYEATGLTPEDCAEYRKFEDEIIASGKTFGRLVELLRADKEGRVVVLPCKVGDTVYATLGGEIVEQIICKIIINGCTNPRIWVERYCPFIATHPKRWDSSIGKDFYLTREEAEEALRRGEDG